MWKFLSVAVLLGLVSGINNTAKAQGTKKGQSAKSRFADSANASVGLSADTIPLREPDDTKLHIVGYGNMWLSYTETIDGYTILTNDIGVYEYVRQAKDGDLLLTGIKADDPDKRDKKEIGFLKKWPKHLRYQSPYIESMLKKKKHYNYEKRQKQ